MTHLVLTPKRHISSFRRIAIGTWRTAKDPSVYGSLVLDADPVLDYIEAFRQATGRHLTLTHLMAKVMGHVYEAIPDLNAVLRYGRIYVRRDVGVFFQVAMQDPQTGEIDLSGLTVRDPGQRTVLEIVDDFERVAHRVRAGQDEEKEQTRRTLQRMPGWLARPALNLLSFLLYTLNLDLRWAGLPRDPFGSVMVTNIGSLGLDEAYVPLVPYSRVPLLVSVGAVQQAFRPDEEGQPRWAHTVRLSATFDHRILDGAHAARMAWTVRWCFANPEAAFGPIPPASGTEAHRTDA